MDIIPFEDEDFVFNEKTSSLKRSFLRMITIHDFLENPSGYLGWTYHVFLVVSNLIYMILILMETADGPNHYQHHHRNVALFSRFPTYDQYLILKLFFSVPLIIHCLTRLVLATILYHFASPFSSRSFSKFFGKTSNLLLCLWFWPLLIESAAPGTWPINYMAVYHGIDFLRHLQILLTFKEVPSFLVVKETYRRVVRLVPIPVFLFFVFNILVAVILYLVDPCFNVDSCPFESLFDAFFYSIVTMTTTGYGNQIPQYVPGRIIAIIIMLFGAPYLAIPIGIIDHEYGKSWTDFILVQKEKERLAKEAGIEHIGNTVTKEQAALAQSNSVPETKVKVMTLHSTITEMLLSLKLDVASLRHFGAKVFALSGGASIGPKHEPQEDDKATISQKMTAIVLKLVRLHHRFAALSEIMAVELKTSLETNNGERRKMGTTALLADKANNDPANSTNKIKLETQDLIAKLAKEAQSNPVKSYLRILLDVPNSSDEGMVVNFIIVVCIFFSVVLLFWQTKIEFVPHGENSHICEEVVRLYCHAATSPILDPGCYVTSTLNSANPQLLGFHCSSNSCFGRADNFGALGNWTCLGEVAPFRSQDLLPPTNFMNSREHFQSSFAVCSRRECGNTPFYFDANRIWLYTEISINVIFGLEIAARIFMSSSLRAYVSYLPNWFDVVSVIPFIVECFTSAVYRKPINFSFISSDPLTYASKFTNILKIVRMLKLVRRFPSAQIVIYVFSQAWKELLRFYVFILLFAMCAGMILFDVNLGHGCYFGVTCPSELELTHSFTYGQYVLLVDSSLEPVNIVNAMYGFWFAMVTMATVGYGEIVPKYWSEYIIAIILMLLGAFFMAIPLSIVTRHFSASYDQLEQKQQIRGKALKHFAKHNRKSSAFVVKQIVSRRLSAITRRQSTASISSVVPMSDSNRSFSRTSDASDRSSFLSEPELTAEKIAQNRSIAQFKKEMEALNASKKKKDAADARTLCVDYQQHAKFILTNLKNLAATIGDKDARKSVRVTIRQSMRSGPGASADALAALRAKVNALKPGGTATGSPSADSRNKSVSAPKLSVLAAIDEDEDSGDEKSESGGNKPEKISKEGGDDEAEDDEEDDLNDENEDDDNDDEYDEDEDGNSIRKKSRRKSSSTTSLTPKLDNIEAITMQLLELVEKLLKFHVSNGSPLRDLLDINTDFEDDASKLLETFRANMNVGEDISDAAARNRTNTGSSTAGKANEMREADMLERLGSPTWGSLNERSLSGHLKKRLTTATEILRNSLKG